MIQSCGFLTFFTIGTEILEAETTLLIRVSSSSVSFEEFLDDLRLEGYITGLLVLRFWLLYTLVLVILGERNLLNIVSVPLATIGDYALVWTFYSACGLSEIMTLSPADLIMDEDFYRFTEVVTWFLDCYSVKYLGKEPVAFLVEWFLYMKNLLSSLNYSTSNSSLEISS